MKDGKFTPEFDSLVAETIKRWNVPGLSVAVIEGDSTCTQVSINAPHLNTLLPIILPRPVASPDFPERKSSRRHCSIARA